MDEQEIIEDDVKHTDSPSAIPPAEAGFSINWNMIDASGISTQVTMRGAMVGDWPEVMRQRAAFLERAKKGGWTVNSAAKPAGSLMPTPTSATERAEASGKGTLPPPTPVAPSGGAVAGANGILEMHVSKMQVEPQADGKVKVSFFEPGHRFPDIYSTRLATQWVKDLSATGAWTTEHLQTAGEYPVSFKIAYTLSQKLNTKGNPYKDIASIKFD